ncbi:MAG: GNAT family N-acetyltransferase [Oscillospiraceae bacterium]|nr:GNAT family N-acetyltransferase [Oscillospiraceae bacterium]
MSTTSLGYDYALAKTETKLAKIIFDNSQAVFVADIGEKVVGYIHIANYDVIYAVNYKNILGFAVNNDYKRQGIGTALLSAAEKLAEENGAVGVRLESGIERTDAHILQCVRLLREKIAKKF